MLTGKTRSSTFEAGDHRRSTAAGRCFDVDETFSGVPYEVGFEAVERLRPLVPHGATLAQLALRWILIFEAVTCAISGAKNEQQRDNLAVVSLPTFNERTMVTVQAAYDRLIRPHVHGRW
jgi:aryl-alcohol dehydrogenase-like predicted oxidoreductase